MTLGTRARRHIQPASPSFQTQSYVSSAAHKEKNETKTRQDNNEDEDKYDLWRARAFNHHLHLFKLNPTFPLLLTKKRTWQKQDKTTTKTKTEMIFGARAHSHPLSHLNITNVINMCCFAHFFWSKFLCFTKKMQKEVMDATWILLQGLLSVSVFNILLIK